ncbi:MAG: zf-HC2 domain-containing protein [Pseudomonadota bacterium]
MIEPEHPEELLPWYANDTLTGDERQRVEDHLRDCGQCRQELAWLQRLRQQVKGLQPLESPGELVRAKLLREVRSQPRRQRVQWWQAALAASLAVIVIQGAVIFRLSGPGNMQVAAAPIGSLPGQEALVRIRFKPTATETQIRQALRVINGAVVDGPGDSGVYYVRLEGLDTTQPFEIQDAVQRLKTASPVVLDVGMELLS